MVWLKNRKGSTHTSRWMRQGVLCAWGGMLVWMGALAGCSTVVAYPAQKTTLLRPAQMSPDAVGLEVFFVRFPLADPELNETLWQELDEQALPASLRRELWKNGLRAAVVGGPVPVRLARLLKMTDQPPSAEEASVSRVQVREAEKIEPWISCRRLSLRAGCRSEVIASGVYEEITILRPEPGGLAGHTFRKAQGLFGMYVQPLRDGRIEMELTPEVHYGDPAQRWVGEQGMFRLEFRRERQTFPELTIRSVLAPGEILLVSCLPEREGSLGWYFFTQTTSGDPQQKLLLVRLAQTQQDELFGAEGNRLAEVPLPPKPIR